MVPRRTYASLVALAVAIGGCGGEEQTSQAPETTPEASEQAAEPTEQAQWEYEGERGPDNWAELSADYTTCEAGREQSPVDLADAERTDLADVEFDYRPASYEVVNNGHTVQANVTDAGGITLDGESYELLQFHAHTPSEHTEDGQRSDLELHLVHQNDQGELAVVGVLMDEGESGALSEAWSQLPQEGETQQLESFDAARLLPEDTRGYRYDGSLTTPPCTEDVSWIVMDETTRVDAELVSSFRELLGETARPVQPLGDRELEVDTRSE